MVDVLHKNLIGTDIHEPKDIAIATIGQAYVADGLGSGDWTGNVTNNPLSEVVINSLSDFPTPSGGIITLAGNTNYILGADVSTSNSFLSGNGTTITGNSPFSPTLTYTGTGSMFTGVDTNFNIYSMNISCPNAQVFNFSESGLGGLTFFVANFLLVNICTKLATFSKVGAIQLINFASVDMQDGVTISGTATFAASFRQINFVSTNTSFVGIDFGSSVQQTVELTDFILIGGVGSIGIQGATNSANITTGFIANVTNGNYAGVTTPLSGIAVDDIRWRFRDNGGIPDTKMAAFSSMITNVTPTVIASAGVPVKVAGTFTEQLASFFSTDTTGRITYLGEQDLIMSIDIVISGEIGVGTDDVTLFLALNGTAIAGSGHQQEFTTGDPNNVTTIWMLTLVTNDFLEIFIQNNDTTEDITVLDAKFRGN